MEHTKTTRPLRIWLIEDHMPDVFLIERSFRQYHIECELTRFVDGEQVLVALQVGSVEPETLPDLILLDLNLPKVSGLDVLRLTREDPFLRKVHVIVLTSSNAPQDREMAKQLGADQFITKPVELHAYLTAVGSSVRELFGMNDLDRASGAAN